jgi:hypothetical protein
LTECASDGNPRVGEGGKEANPGNVERNGQFGGEGSREEKCAKRTNDGQYRVA